MISSPSPAAARQDSAAAPEEPRKTETNGPGVSAGIGSQYVAFGIQLSYYFRLPHSLYHVVPYVAFGTAPATANNKNEVDWLPAFAFGALGSWGHKHRFVLNLFYSPIGYTYVSLHGEKPDLRLEWGPGLTAGYEYVAFSGFYMRFDAGIQYMVTAPIFAPKDRFAPAVTLIGLGYKLW